jgi:lipopolysaccharide biosynthesis regulator YciM
MHQNLVERSDLAPEQRLHALYELAQDYFKAGLLDRAEELFLKLEGSSHTEDALRFLLEIYEQEKEWERAIGIAEKLETVTGRSHQKEIANFHCELAGSEIMQSRPDAARPHIAEALAHHRLCVRANVLLGDLEAQAGRPEAAIEAWKRIESQNPAYLALVAERIYNAFKQRRKTGEGSNLLRGYLAKYPSLDLMNVVFQGTLEMEGTAPAYRLVRDELRRTPTLLGLDKLLEAQMLEAPLERRRDLGLIKELVNQHTRSLAMYKCDNCGFRARQYYWHCPACAAWETYSPRRTEEAKLPA